jgi:hypothetical protein
MKQFFEWAIEVRGYDMTRLAAALGYSERHLYRIRAGEISNLRNFEARAIARFGDEVRSFFAPSVPLESYIDITAQ